MVMTVFFAQGNVIELRMIAQVNRLLQISLMPCQRWWRISNLCNPVDSFYCYSHKSHRLTTSCPRTWKYTMTVSHRQSWYVGSHRNPVNETVSRSTFSRLLKEPGMEWDYSLPNCKCQDNHSPTPLMPALFPWSSFFFALRKELYPPDWSLFTPGI